MLRPSRRNLLRGSAALAATKLVAPADAGFILGKASGGSGGGIPAWAVALRDLASNPTDFLFAYNFATGGTGEGWNNTTQELLTLNDAWQAGSPGNPVGGPYLGDIVSGFGIVQAGSGINTGTTVDGTLPNLSTGATILFQAQAYTPVTSITDARPFLHLVDLPDDNFEGGINLKWDAENDWNQFRLENGNGVPSLVDTIEGKVNSMRGVCNYLLDGSALAGSVNGRPVGTATGSVVSVAPNTLTIDNTAVFGTSDVPVYITIVAVFLLQPEVSLSSMSAL